MKTIYLLFIIFLVQVGQCSQVFMGVFKIKDNHKLVGNATITKTADGQLECAQFCLNVQSCQSINFNKNLKMCELFETKIEGYGEALEEAEGWYYMERTDTKNTLSCALTKDKTSCEEKAGENIYQLVSYNYPNDRWGLGLASASAKITDRSTDWLNLIIHNEGGDELVSFEDARQKGYCLCKIDNKIEKMQITDTDTKSSRCTFKIHQDKWFKGYEVFEFWPNNSRSNKYIRNWDYWLYLDDYDGSDLFKEDASFKRVKVTV